MNKFPITLYLYNKEVQTVEEFDLIEEYESYFEQVVILSPDELEYLYPDHPSKTAQWNEMVRSTHTPWALFLDGGEQLDLSELDALSYIDQESWASTLISLTGFEQTEFYHQLRLVPTFVDEEIFSGHQIPDASRFVQRNNIKLLPDCLHISRKSYLWQDVDLELERAQSPMPTTIHLYEARNLIKNNKYVQAAAEYRQVLKKADVLPFDYLAGLNGVARCYAEQHKWTRALEYTEESIAREKQQYMPYLIQFRIYQMNKNWGAALESLEHYWDNTKSYSRSSHETILPISETLLQMSNLSLKAGKNELAYTYLTQYIRAMGEELDPQYQHAALTLAIELSMKKEALLHLNALYPNPVLFEFTEEEEARFHDYLELFLNQSWFEPVQQIYTALYNARPESEHYKRRLIVTLIKSDRLDQAKSLLYRVA